MPEMDADGRRIADEDDEKENIPEEVIITVNVSDWDPDKTETADEASMASSPVRRTVSKDE